MFCIVPTSAFCPYRSLPSPKIALICHLTPLIMHVVMLCVFPADDATAPSGFDLHGFVLPFVVE